MLTDVSNESNVFIFTSWGVVKNLVWLFRRSFGSVEACGYIGQYRNAKIVYGHPCQKFCLRKRSQCSSGRREYKRVCYTLISQFIPQSARIKVGILMGNLEVKMDVGDLNVDGSKISYWNWTQLCVLGRRLCSSHLFTSVRVKVEFFYDVIWYFFTAVGFPAGGSGR